MFYYKNNQKIRTDRRRIAILTVNNHCLPSLQRRTSTWFFLHNYTTNEGDPTPIVLGGSGPKTFLAILLVPVVRPS